MFKEMVELERKTNNSRDQRLLIFLAYLSWRAGEKGKERLKWLKERPEPTVR